MSKLSRGAGGVRVTGSAGSWLATMRGGGGAGGVEEQAAATRTSPVTARRRTRVRPNSRSIARELIVAAGSVASCCLPYFGKDAFGQSVPRLDDEALRQIGRPSCREKGCQYG